MKVCCTSNILISTQHNNHGSCKRQAIKPTMQVAPKVMPPISLETTAATKNTITLFDRANSQLQKSLSQHTILSTISCVSSPAMNKSLYPALMKTCTSKGNPLSLLPPLEHTTRSSLGSHPLSGLQKHSGSVNECQWMQFFSAWRNSVAHLCFMCAFVSDDIFQTAPLLPSVTRQQQVT